MSNIFTLANVITLVVKKTTKNIFANIVLFFYTKDETCIS